MCVSSLRSVSKKVKICSPVTGRHTEHSEFSATVTTLPKILLYNTATTGARCVSSGWPCKICGLILKTCCRWPKLTIRCLAVSTCTHAII
jgi:hypothetical protein